MDKNINDFLQALTKKIKNKNFSNEISGYDMSDVDSFLDEILSSIELINNYFFQQINQINELKLQISTLNANYEKVLKQCKMYNDLLNKNLSDSVNYLSILERVSKLEKEIFSKE